MRFIPELSVLLLAVVLSGCDSKSPEVMRSWDQTSQGLYAGAISEDGRFNLAGSLNHGASLWRNKDQERLFDWNHRQGEYTALVATDFSPDGSRAVTTDPRTLVLWDALKGTALGYWATPTAVLAVALASDGRHVLMGMEDDTAVYFDAISGTYGATLLHQGRVYSVSLSQDDSRALTGSDDNTAKLWDMTRGIELLSLEHSNPVRVAALSPDARFAFTAAQGEEVTLWNAETGASLLSLHKKNPGVTSAIFAPENDQLLVGYVNRTIELWDIRGLKLLHRWRMKTRNSWHPTGSAVAALSFGSRRDRYLVMTGSGRMYELKRS